MRLNMWKIITLFVILSKFSILQTSVTDDSECFVVESDTTFKCYKFMSTNLHDHCTAEGYCSSNGGRLAAVQSSQTWITLVEKFLKKWKSDHIWVGLKVPSYRVDFNHPIDLTDSDHWDERKLSVKYSLGNDRCMIANSSNNWKWELTSKCDKNLAFICEYDVPNCNMSEVKIAHADFRQCYTTNLLPLYHSIEINCWDGYFLIGSKEITCKMGVWMKPFPECIRACHLPPDSAFATIVSVRKKYYNISEKIQFTCNDGFVSWKDFTKTHFEINCQENGTWSENNYHCVSINDTSVVTININELENDEIILECKLHDTKRIQWLQNGKIVTNSAKFAMPFSTGLLVINKTYENITGVYCCQQNSNGNFELGNKSYHLIALQSCIGNSSANSQIIEVNEDANILLNISHSCDFGEEIWYKDGRILKNNYHHQAIPNHGFYLRGIKLYDEGIYKCEVKCKDTTDFFSCKTVAIYKLSISASVESICGQQNFTISSNRPPWLVLFSHEEDTAPFCYGNILNHQWIITSAFCLSPLLRKKNLSGIFVHLEPKNYTYKLPISSVKVHPMYRSRPNSHDIGLVKLMKPLMKFTNNLIPICIPNADFSFKYSCSRSPPINGTVIGWGLLSNDNPNLNSSVKIENMSLVSKDECYKLIGFSEDVFCTQTRNSDEIYAADAGAPFLVNNNDRLYLLGIYSWGGRFLQAGEYDYYTSVFHYYNWIKNVTEYNVD